MNSSAESAASVAASYQGGLRRRKKKRARRNETYAQALDRPADSKKTTTYETQIMHHWDCRIEDSLPVELRPVIRLANGKRVGHEQIKKKKKLPSAKWPNAFKGALCKLAAATPRDMDLAHKELAKQVKQRQLTGSHQEHYAREALTSDVEAVCSSIKTLTLSGRYRPKKTENKLEKLFEGPGRLDANDTYDGSSPEERAAATINVTEQMVKEWLGPDREAQQLEDSWKHLKAKSSTAAIQQPSPQHEREAYNGEDAGSPVDEADPRAAGYWEQTEEEMAEYFRRKYCMG